MVGVVELFTSSVFPKVTLIFRLENLKASPQAADPNIETSHSANQICMKAWLSKRLSHAIIIVALRHALQHTHFIIFHDVLQEIYYSLPLPYVILT